MSYTVEDILAAKMLAEQQNPDPAVAMTVGATGGAMLGATIGEVPHQLGRAINTGRQVASKARSGKGINVNRIKPGSRMAGGLIGTILGGGLGLGMAEAMKNSSPAGALLSKISQEGMTPNNEAQLQRAMAYSTY